MPPTRPTALRGAVSDALSFYSDAGRSLPPLLGPAGWHCWVVTGADGSGEIAVFPPGEILPLDVSATAGVGKDRQAVVASWTPACQGCVYDKVCAVVPAASAQLGHAMGPCAARPPGERVTWIRGSPSSVAVPANDVIDFEDPGGTLGGAPASGGNFTTYGVLEYQYADAHGTAAEVTCTLATSLQALCPVIVDDVVQRAWGMPVVIP